MINKVFTFHTDPGHGWLKVTLDDLAAVKLQPSDFSSYSYRSWDGRTMYLEEDCDAPMFEVMWLGMQGSPIKVIKAHTEHDSPIRKLLHNSVDVERRVAAS